MRKRFLSLLCVLALCLGLLPVTALAAAEGAPNSLYVGNQQVISSSDITYWTTDESTGGLTKYEGNNDNWNVKYDPSTATLTLSGATIKGGSDVVSIPYGSGIYAQGSSNQPVTLTIELIGENTITGTFGIYVNATPPTTPGTDASLVIKKSGDNGSLTVTGTGNSGLHIISGTGDASLTIKNASVDAKTTQTYSSYAGVCVQSGASATDSPQLSLAVNGGSLTVSGSTSGDGIQFYVGSSQATGATTSLTVSENAIVDARNGGISASGVSVNPNVDIGSTGSTGSTGGIVFDGTEGTVYGKVELQKDLEIKSGETLTIPEGSTLTVPEDKILTNNGTIDNSGTLTNNGTVTNNGTLNVNEGGKLEGETTGGSGTVVNTPTITAQPANQTVTAGNTATFTVTATSENLTYQWSQSTDQGESWREITGATGSTYTTAATTTSMSGYQYRCEVSNSAGSVTSEVATLTVNEPAPTTYTITADVDPVEAGTVTVNGSGTSDTVTANSDVTLTATANEGYRFTGWMENDQQVSTDATYTFQATCNRTLTAKFEKKVTGVTLDKETLALYTGDSATLTAAVEPSDAANQNVTWQSDNANVATVQNGTVTAVGAGETTITVQTQDGNYTATCKVTVTQSTYSISADTTALNFGSVYTGYAQPAAKTVTITNTGNQPVTVALPTSENFTVTAGAGFQGGKAVLAPGKTAAFSVRPKTGLSTGTYSELLHITGSNDASADVALRFEVTRKPAYAVTVQETTGGTVTVSHQSAAKGRTVTVTVTPEAGYALERLTVTDKYGSALKLTALGGGKYSFEMPASQVTIQAVFVPEQLPFVDVKPTDWFYEAVAYVYEHGLMDGVGSSRFTPNASTTRAMIVTILWRLEGEPEVDCAMPFEDVADHTWYTEAVRWAAGEGIVEGYSETAFGPSDPITREQLAAILYRYAKYLELDVSIGEDTNILSYTDAAEISEYAIPALQWACGSGLMEGSNGSLNPRANATRAEVATMLMRVCEACAN